MNRLLQWINLAGILALGALSLFQWQANRQANLEAARAEKTVIEQTDKIAEQDKALKGAAADLDSFREQLIAATKKANETETRGEGAERELHQAARERDELKARIANWSSAVEARDKQLKEYGQKLETLAAERNEAILKFNGLADKYNQVVKDLNDANSKLAAVAAARTNSAHGPN